jgi:NAD(P)-dependent dehydrogenase (short-subunit alcohol dehydrogenase family)
MVRLVPLGRLGQPADLKGLAVFLAATASAYVTGTVVPIDGGFAAT